MGRQAKLKANRRKNLIKRKVKLPFGGKNCDIQVVRRFNLEDFRVENWDVSLERNIFDGNIDIWIDCSDSIPGIPLYFIDSCRLEPTMTVPRKNAWNVIAANREFQEDLASTLRLK